MAAVQSGTIFARAGDQVLHGGVLAPGDHDDLPEDQSAVVLERGRGLVLDHPPDLVQATGAFLRLAVQ
jgi:hypothetical protein